MTSNGTTPGDSTAASSAVYFTDSVPLDETMEEPPHMDLEAAPTQDETIERRVDVNAKDRHPDADYMKGARHFTRAITKGAGYEENDPWRQKMAHIFESQRFHVLIIFLTLLDLVFIVSELCIEVVAQSESCQLVTGHSGGEPEAEIILSHGVEIALDVLFWLSICILSLFCIEIFFKFIVFGPLHFWKHKFELADAIIVITSITLDLVFKGKEETIAIELLIFLRLWRIIRVMDGVAGEVQESVEVNTAKFEKEIKLLKRQLAETNKEVEKLHTILQPTKSMIRA